MAFSTTTAASPSDRLRFRRLTEDRLRVSLSLLLPAPTATVLAARTMKSAPDDPLDALRSLAASVSREFLVSRITARLPRRSAIPTRERPLGPRTGISAHAALSLALHLGLALDAETLADVLEPTPEQVGELLDTARRQAGIDPVSVRPVCTPYAGVRGRYADPSLEPDDRVRLLTHLHGCSACRAAVERAEALDARLTALIDEAEVIPASPASTRASVAWPILAVLTVGVISVVLLVLAVASELSDRGHEPIPLRAGTLDTEVAADASTLSGWLLQRSPEGYLEALNLATGETRGLDSTDNSPSPPVYLVGDRYIATWRPSDGRRGDTLAISPIGGQVMLQMSWDRMTEYWYPSGWLDDTTLLIARSPTGVGVNEPVDEFYERLARDSRLVAVDVESGDEWEVMRGNVAAAFPSPDGSMIAISSPVDSRWPGTSMELRPIVDGVAGDPIVTLAHRLAEDGVWSRDSQRFFAPVVADEEVVRRDDGEGTYQQLDLVVFGRDGSMRTLVRVDAPASLRAMAASPDGQTVVYLEESEPELRRDSDIWRCVRLDVPSGELLTLAEGTGNPLVYPPTWSPDGQQMVMPVARTFPLEDGADVRSRDLVATALMTFDYRASSAVPQRVLYGTGRQLYRWMPTSTLAPDPPSPVVEISGDFSPPEVMTQIQAGQRLTGDSMATSDGRYVVLDDTINRSPVIVEVVAQSKRVLSYNATDISWFNNNQIVIAVAPARFQAETTRLILYVPDISINSAYLDYQRYDPANLGGDMERTYALPLVSPDGSRVSFFVIDRRANRVALWLDRGDGPAAEVYAWSVPADARLDPPLVATWVDSRTLLIGEPDRWKDGLPRAVRLSRVDVPDRRDVAVEPLVDLDARSGDRGVVLTELAMSPDGADLAYRLRHYSELSAERGRRDSLHIASTDDLSHAVEIARGTPGEGLTWAPDSRWIFAGIRSRIAALSADGRDLVYLTPDDAEAAWPIWTNANDIWFSLESRDEGSRVWRVRPE